MQCVHPMLMTMLSQVLLVYLLLSSKYVSPSMHFNFHPHQNMYLHVLLQPHKYVLSLPPWNSLCIIVLHMWYLKTRKRVVSSALVIYIWHSGRRHNWLLWPDLILSRCYSSILTSSVCEANSRLPPVQHRYQIWDAKL